MSDKKAKVIIIDADIVFRTSIRYALERSSAYTFISEYGRAEDALRNIKEENADIIMMDSALPGIDGVKACRMITGNTDSGSVILFSDDPGLAPAALASGATFCISKDTPVAELTSAMDLIRKWQSMKKERDGYGHPLNHIEKIMTEHRGKNAARLSPAKTPGAKHVPEEISLFVRHADHNSCLNLFMHRLEKSVMADIVEVVGTAEHTRVTIRPHSASSYSAAVTRLARMPEVERVTEETDKASPGWFIHGKPQREGRKKLYLALNEPDKPASGTGHQGIKMPEGRPAGYRGGQLLNTR